MTVGRVASTSIFYFCEGLRYKGKCTVRHDHSLLRLKEVLNKYSDTLIIVGIRNPIERNLSYLFQTYDDDRYNEVKTRCNDYKGEYCYMKEYADKFFTKINIDDFIKSYFNMNYHNTFNEWFEEFFELTGIDKLSFDKEKGFSYYNLPNNNKVVIYTFEKLKSFQKELCKIFNHDKIYTEKLNCIFGRNSYPLYIKMKNEIKYTKEYADNLLNTKIMKFFYSEEDIKKMYDKITIV
jgi:hypothetical protein